MAQANRRAHERKSMKAEAWIEVPPGEKWTRLRPVDMSTGGFAFISDEQIGVNTTRYFRLQLPNDGGLMHVEGQIMHCVGLADTGGYRVGVKAIQVDLLDVGSMTRPLPDPDPKLDLVLIREVDISADAIWDAWTKPELLKKWFTPAPWKTTDCEIDLRPGGIFRTVMEGPRGERVDNAGCYLEIVEREKLVWTNALLPGCRPAGAASGAATDFKFTVILSLEEDGTSTKYTAMVLHPDEEGRKQHEAMGFYEGWNAALDQLIAMVTAK